MASMRKFTHPVAAQILSHNARLGKTFENCEHIDPGRTSQNYSLIADGYASDYDRYRARKAELYCMQRGDVKTLIGWVCTLTRNILPQEERAFFAETYAFFCQRYGEKNIVQAVVHHDEAGQPHMHICLIPAVPDHKHIQGEKICANSVATRKDLMTFHADWQKHLVERGICTRVSTGITMGQGGNKTVEELKRGNQRVDHVLECSRWGNSGTIGRENETANRWATKRRDYEFENGGRW